MSAFLFRPLATSLDDKVILQDCLEVGRTAKVETFSLICQIKTFVLAETI